MSGHLADFRPCFFAPDLHPVFASKGNGTHGVLALVIADFDSAVAGLCVFLQFVPAIQCVGARFSQDAFRERLVCPGI